MRNILWRYQLPGAPDVYAAVDNAFGAAVAAWNAVTGSAIPRSGLTIEKAVGREDSCSARPGDDITWYVTTTPQNTNAGASLQYMTFALGPKYFGGSPTGGDPENRYFMLNDYIVQSFFPGSFNFANAPDWSTVFSMNGLMLHAIASGLGFLGEENRIVPQPLVGYGDISWPEQCRDPSVGGIFLSDPDIFSVTLQPVKMKPFMGIENGFDRGACSGYRQYDYAISYTDAMGAACQYRKDGPGAASVLYYCNQQYQIGQRARHGFSCSPVPLSSAGECDGPYTQWDGDAEAIGNGILSALMQLL